MSDTCFTCHGPDEDDNPSGLRLDSFEMATEAAIVLGKAKSSAVFQRITDDADPMPPKEFRHQLSDYEKALIEKWIDQGAQYQKAARRWVRGCFTDWVRKRKTFLVTS